MAGERLGRVQRNQSPTLGRGRHLVGLESERGVAARTPGRDEAVVQVLHRRLGVERHDGILELVRAQLRRDVGGDEDERVPDRDLTPPDDRGRVLHRKAALPPSVGQGHEVRLADEVGLHGTGRDHVQLVAADHGQADPDGAGRPVAEREPVPLGEEAAIRRADRLLETDDEARGLIVVVLALDGVGDEADGVAQSPTLADAGHDEEEAPLGADRRADRRLDDDDGVWGVLEPLGLGHQAELHLQSDGHAIRRT